MGYKIDFIGLVCFLDRGETRLAFFPDGRNVDGELGGIAPHHARIVVPSAPPGQPQSVLDADWWQDQDDTEVRIFPIPEPVVLTISGLAGRGVNATQHDQRTPRLSDDNSLQVDEENAKTIVRLGISAGTLQALEFEGGVVSQLDVPDHDEKIVITATTADGTVRTLTLVPGTEIVLRNTSDDVTGGQDEHAHFRIYRQLAPNSLGVLSTPTLDLPNLPDLVSEHPDLRPEDGAFGGRNCSNVAAR